MTIIVLVLLLLYGDDIIELIRDCVAARRPSTDEEWNRANPGWPAEAAEQAKVDADALKRIMVARRRWLKTAEDYRVRGTDDQTEEQYKKLIDIACIYESCAEDVEMQAWCVNEIKEDKPK